MPYRKHLKLCGWLVGASDDGEHFTKGPDNVTDMLQSLFGVVSKEDRGLGG